MLEIKNLTKTYLGGKKAVDDLSLTIEIGDIYGFIGANGSGKTTTLKAIVGIHEFDSGEIKVDGYSIKKDSIHCKSLMAYIPDNPDIYEHLTGRQFINFIADMYEVTLKNRKERTQKYGDLFEMTINLATVTLKEIMRELVLNGGAIFFSTHVLDVAEKLCNKIAIIKDGRLIASGLTNEVRGNKSLEALFMEVLECESLKEPSEVNHDAVHNFHIDLCQKRQGNDYE